MTSNKYLADLIQTFKTKTGKTIAVIALETGIHEENLYKWEKGTMPRNPEVYNSLMAYLRKGLGMDPLHAVETPGAAYGNPLQYTVTVRLPLTSGSKPFPNTDTSLSCGNIIYNDGAPELIVHRFNAPFIAQAEGVLEVVDDSMYPTFPRGTYVAITRIKDVAKLVWGECYYIIDNNEQGILRRVYEGKSPGTIKLMTDNKVKGLYSPAQHHVSELIAVLKVKAHIIKM